MEVIGPVSVQAGIEQCPAAYYSRQQQVHASKAPTQAASVPGRVCAADNVIVALSHDLSVLDNNCSETPACRQIKAKVITPTAKQPFEALHAYIIALSKTQTCI